MNRRNFLGLAGAAAVAPIAAPFALASEMKKTIKITGIETDLLRFPKGKIYYDAIHEFGAEGGGVVLRIQTDAGITGWAESTFGTMAGAPETLQTILEKELKPILIGQDPAFPRRVRSELWKGLEYAGVQGMNTFAISAVDTAIWDIVAKAFGVPGYKVLGAYQDTCPVYSMSGWYYPNDDDLSQYKKAVEGPFEEGFSGVKIKVGRFSLQDDVKRIKMAMDIAGPNRRIMVDANQKFLVPEAIQRGKVYQEMGAYWYEEPLVPYDHAGYAQVAEELEIRVAGGENEYTKYAFADLINRHCVDVVQPDARRAGGVSEWMDIATLTAAAKLPLASHGGGPVDLQMLLCMENAIYMESGSYKGSGSTLERLRMVNSAVLAPEMPGMGSELRPEYLKKFKV
jgi:L-alanine-DL-glutamate epimerase-like enolase superfamily enzyme